jgi:hypothetical protein
MVGWTGNTGSRENVNLCELAWNARDHVEEFTRDAVIVVTVGEGKKGGKEGRKEERKK